MAASLAIARSKSPRLLAGFVALALVIAAAGSAEAKKKKSTPSSSSGDTPAAAAGTSGSGDAAAKPTEGAAQADDKEKPHPVIDTVEEAPPTDEKGNVKFQGRKGKGKITVRADKKDGIKIYLEGHFFGVAPVNIDSVPAGDYLVEATYPDGRSVTRAVTVLSDEEEIVQIGEGGAVPTANTDKPKLTPEQAEKRWTTAKFIGIGGVVLLAAGVGFGLWERLGVQKDYDNWIAMTPPPAGTPQGAAFQKHADDLQHKGNILAYTADALFVVGALSIIGATVYGYPAYKARKYYKSTNTNERHGDEAPKDISFIVVPNLATGNGGSAMLSLRF